MVARSRFSLGLAGLAFFASGAAALVYQVTWQRILALHTGVGVYSVALIVAAFMTGLGLGSHLGGTLSVRLRPAWALAAFGALELVIAAFGAASVPIYYDWLYARAGALYSGPWAGPLQFAALLPPTLLMGMSLPLLTRGAVRDAALAGRTIGLLYGINMLGAATGALLAPWLLIRHFGLPGATLAGAAANTLAGALALVLAQRDGQTAAATSAAAPPPPPSLAEPAGRHPLALWLGLYAASGFCALALEVLWFRLLDVATRATAFAFGTLLATYLLGCALGCITMAGRAPRLARPLRFFLLCQCGLLAYAGLAVAALVRLPTSLPGLAGLYSYWRAGSTFRLGEAWEPSLLLLLYGTLPVALFGLPTFLMGLSFPALQRAVQDDAETCGRKVGLLQAANVAGCVTGSLAVGLLGLSWLGTSASLRLVVGAGVPFALVGLRAYGRRGGFVPALALALLATAAVPDGERLWARLHGSDGPDTLVSEDATSVSAVVPSPDGWHVTVNGKHHSRLPFGGIHTRLGALPALVHPAPREVAIIGLGSGDTAWAAGCRRETRRLTVFEIAGGQRPLLARVAALQPLPELRALLEDPRLVLRVADGRHAIARRLDRYDLIEADALWPYAAGSGNLFSVEFFEECAARLAPGGLMCTWAPTPRVMAAFRTAFPHVLGPRNRSFLIGSREPLAVDVVAWRARALEPTVRDYLGGERVLDLVPVLERLAAVEDPLDEDVLPNRDLFPRDEFLAP